MTKAYRQGFMSKCAERGIDGRALLKFAEYYRNFSAPQSFYDGPMPARPETIEDDGSAQSKAARTMAGAKYDAWTRYHASRPPTKAQSAEWASANRSLDDPLVQQYVMKQFNGVPGLDGRVSATGSKSSYRPSGTAVPSRQLKAY